MSMYDETECLDQNLYSNWYFNFPDSEMLKLILLQTNTTYSILYSLSNGRIYVTTFELLYSSQ